MAFIPVFTLLMSGFACGEHSAVHFWYEAGVECHSLGYLVQSAISVVLTAGFVALCNASDGRQLFVVEQTVHDGPYVSGPITGPDGLTLNIFGNVRTDNSDIAFSPFQGSSNAYWVVLPDLDLVYSPFYGSCLSACEDVT